MPTRRCHLKSIYKSGILYFITSKHKVGQSLWYDKNMHLRWRMADANAEDCCREKDGLGL